MTFCLLWYDYLLLGASITCMCMCEYGHLCVAYICVCVHVHMCLQMHMCVKARNQPLVSSSMALHLRFSVEVSEPGIGLFSWTSEPVTAWHPPFSTFCTATTSAFTWVLEIRSLCFGSKHFTSWAFVKAPYFIHCAHKQCHCAAFDFQIAF